IGGPTDPANRVTLAGFTALGEIRKRVTPRVILRGTAGYQSDDLTQNQTRRSLFVTFGAEYYY
ncbi:MAG: hypothetical protein R3344_12860, partial [Acidobacteriota bacterium]|nr:hypothetical protein [Acidobacteriota bacterium]